MKKQALNPKKIVSGKTILRLALATLFLCSLSFANAKSIIANEPPLEIKYLGAPDGQPVFQIQFDNASGETYVLSIKSDDGTVLYTEKVKDKKFLKKIKWNNSDTDKTKLIFTLTGEKEKTTQMFEINTTLRQVQDVVVTKL